MQLRKLLSVETYLVLGVEIDGVAEIFTGGDVELDRAEGPRDEYDVALLRVEREVFDVERAVRPDEGRVHPQDAAVRRHNRVRHHVLVIFLAGAEATTATQRFVHVDKLKPRSCGTGPPSQKRLIMIIVMIIID